MPVWQGGLGGGLPWRPLRPWRLPWIPPRPVEAFPSPWGRALRRQCRGLPTGGTEIRPRLTRWVGTTELLSKWANNPKTVTC